MTLTEFLMARIAEDESETFKLPPYRCEPGCCAPAGWAGHQCLICGTEEYGGTVEAMTQIAREHEESIHRRSRVLADCEAKRRILRDPLVHSFLDQARLSVAGERLLRALALPYADHVDYQREWAA